MFEIKYDYLQQIDNVISVHEKQMSRIFVRSNYLWYIPSFTLFRPGPTFGFLPPNSSDRLYAVQTASATTVRNPPFSSSYSALAVVPPGDVTCNGCDEYKHIDEEQVSENVLAFSSFLTLFLSIEIESSDCIANDALPRIVVVTSLTAISRGNPM